MPRPARRRARPRPSSPAHPRAAWAVSPCAWPASRIRRVCAAVNTPGSMNTSQKPASLLPRNRRDHLVDEQIDVCVAAVAVLGRKLVRTQERRHDVQRHLLATRRMTRSCLSSSAVLETVAALDLDRRRADGCSMFEMRGAARSTSSSSEQRRARSDRRVDAAALPRDLHVRHAAHCASHTRRRASRQKPHACASRRSPGVMTQPLQSIDRQRPDSCRRSTSSWPTA